MQCPSGICAGDGACELPSGAACDGNWLCRSGICGPDGVCGAVNGSGCGSGQACRTGICATDGMCGAPPGGACGSDAQCRAGTCRAGVCASCDRDADCSPAGFCDDAIRTCVPRRAASAPCARDAQCAPGACGGNGRCIAGFRDGLVLSGGGCASAGFAGALLLFAVPLLRLRRAIGRRPRRM